MSALTSFANPVHALVVGASGGLGRALVAHLLADNQTTRVTAWARSPLDLSHPKLETVVVDITDESSIARAAAQIEILHLVIVATGVLHDNQTLQPEKSWRALDADALARTFAVNTIGPALIAKHTLSLLPKEGRAVFAALSARVGSIGDNRLGGWYGYRASKAALNQILRTLSIELSAKRQDAICVGLHPGTVDTALSKPFQSRMARDTLFTPAHAADQLLRVIDRLTPPHSGRVFAWDGQEIPA
jgi:NAD(P)-dependent dehydrogenase (short-subunit alcohol dehydrogenase family)